MRVAKLQFGKKANRGIIAALAMGLLLVVLAPGALTRVNALNGSWVDGDMPVLTVGAERIGPASSNCFPTKFPYHSYTNPNGSFNSIGRTLEADVCAIQTGLGYFGSLSETEHSSAEFIRPNTFNAFRVVNSAGQQAGLIAVPHQGSFIIPRSDSQSSSGSATFRFFDSFGQAGTFEQILTQNIKELVYKIGTFTTQPLKDSAGNNLQVGTYAFSNNGRWMAVEIRGLGFARVDTQTRQMVLFSTDKFTYGLGTTPFVALAIGDDGNTVIQSGRKVHDLSGCQPAPFAYNSTNTTTGCRERFLSDHLRTLHPGYEGLTLMRFSPDGLSVTGNARIANAQGQIKHYDMTFKVAGYQLQSLSYLAIGDSFSSGEGAHNYLAGTDESTNKCHTSFSSYPYLVAQATNTTDFHSIACSGARILSDYYYGVGGVKYPVLPSNAPDPSWHPGTKFQNTFVELAHPQAITVSMVGNDVGFINKLTRCIAGPDSCFHFKEDRESIVYEIHNKFDTLVGFYNNLKADSQGARVYVLGYPNLFGTGTTACAANVILDPEERLMSRGMVGYLNAVIKAAAQKAGVQYIDVQDALAGHQHCDEATKAVNGLTAGNDIFVNNVGPLGAESFHPNALGQQLMSQSLLVQAENLTKVMPAPDPTKTAPYIGSNEYNEFVGTAPSGGIYRRATYTTLEGLEWMGKAITTPLKVTDVPSLLPNSQFTAWLFSTPTQIGTVSTDTQGKIDAQITIPASVEPGYHTLRLLGQNVAGEQVDIYKTIYVAETAEDLDGDGLPNAEDPCVVVEPSGVDADNDGIDDACDPEISELPADTAAPVVTGTPDRQPNEDGWYNDNVTITWNATDAEPSSGAPTQPAPTVADQEGTHTYTSDQSCDPANNCATGSLELHLDKTAPEINYSVSPTPSDGWSLPGVVVSFDCTDALSGIASCPAAQTVLGADGPYPVVGVAVDTAGNTAQTVATVQLDGSAPAPSSPVWTSNPKTTVDTATFTLPFSEPSSGVVAAEYYLGDADPGQGNGATMQVTDNTASVAFGTDFPTGVYKVTVRAKDAVGNWSQPTSDYLVVYDTAGPKFKGKRAVVPNVENGDNLPGLIANNQLDEAKFGFTVKYNELGQIHANSDFQFAYKTGTKCNKPAQAANCHKTTLNATNIEWSTTQGVNNSTGIFQGTATLDIDGAISTVLIRVTGVDGELLSPTSTDRFQLQVFAQGANPNTDFPIYNVNATNIERGNIKIKID